MEDGFTMSDPKFKGPTIGVRHVHVAMLFSMLAIGFGMRTNLSVAIVAMTDSKATTNHDIPTYDWNNKSVILSSFFWGYVTLQAIAGELGNRFGTKWLLIIAMFVNSTACVLTPTMAEVGSYGVIGCRILQGMSQGFFYPSVSNLLGQWVPPSERSRAGAISYAGCPFGIIFTMPATGFIAASTLGWPWSFYFLGTLGYIWISVWYFLGASCPAEHPKITNEEKQYIQRSLNATPDEKGGTPWRSVLTSLPVWAFVVAMIGENWGYATLLTEIPTYIDKIMGVNIKSNGLFSAAPYLANLIFTLIFGVICDHIIIRGYVSRGAARKIFQSLATCVPAIALVALSFLPTDATVLSETMLITAVGVNGAIHSGVLINPVDLAPNYSGIIMGFGNGLSQIFSIIAPLAVQFLVTDEEDKSLWRIIFITAAAMFVGTNLFFVLLSSGEVQPWNYSNAKTTTTNNKTTTENEDTPQPEIVKV
ncbi:unnamed protein product [Acanthoscelides obtectus]|uniref:Putative inorganic phosphate cotransporter n=1 Tax=Acanthoscelides obtectus TaxID=200917 RepID=A0A9P0LSX2_ACAOB|nr:unnamed protein product [Acanthoscelides obtectus]CAK1654634.1 Putative inorganic phosphate cotransporter [Acanthoscelides obtectus]